MPNIPADPNLYLAPEQINRLFPFNLLLDRSLTIMASGRSVRKLLGNLAGQSFAHYFSVERPVLPSLSFENIAGFTNQLVVMECRNLHPLVLRGQWEYLPASDQLLFIGSPWYASVEEVLNDNLTLHDFAPHDPLFDLLHVLKAQEITNNDLKELLQTIHKQKERLSKAEQKYRGIIANMHLGLLEVDKEEVIRYVNQSFCDMSGYTPEELLGRNATSLFIAKDKQARMAEKNTLRETGVADAYEVEIHNRDGEKRWWLISGAPMYDESGAMIGSIGIHLDITQQKAMEQDLIKARDEAQASTRSKEIFLANMSHEIRTPLNAILGMAEQLSKTALPAQQVQLATINTAAENLLAIINDVLDLSKIDAGKLSLEHIGFDLNALLERSMQVMRHRAEEKGLTLRLEHDGAGLAPVYIGDPHRINQVLLNLLSNAIKFTEAGTVTITSALLRDSSGRQEIELTVTDTGIGIDEAYLQQIFNPFTQEDDSVTRRYGGTGLGMNICNQLVNLMGGTLQVKSRKGTGTSVSFILPLQKGTAADLPVPVRPAGDVEFSGKRVLVVDDNHFNRMIATMMLRNCSVQVTEATNGIEALEHLRRESFNLVLMDVQMPEMDGLEASRIIRSEISATLPVIALTANAFKSDEDKCIAAGMNGFLAKPFNEQQLIQCMAQWLIG